MNLFFRDFWRNSDSSRDGIKPPSSLKGKRCFTIILYLLAKRQWSFINFLPAVEWPFCYDKNKWPDWSLNPAEWHRQTSFSVEGKVHWLRDVETPAAFYKLRGDARLTGCHWFVNGSCFWAMVGFAWKLTYRSTVSFFFGKHPLLAVRHRPINSSAYGLKACRSNRSNYLRV